MKKNDLTIVLPLRGRYLHTLRWMWYANRICFPYHVIIADGEVHPTINRLLSDSAIFPNVSFEYHRYCDRTFIDCYKKFSETIRKVKTDYVMMSDNDDFLIMAGIQKSVAYLSGDPEYVCAGGRIPSFCVVPHYELPGKVIGQMIGPHFGYKQKCHDISNSSVSERVMDEIDQYQVIYYHVYRTQALRIIFDEVEAHDFSDLTVHEYYCALRAVTFGKARTHSSIICYFRQGGTSSLNTYYKDWVHHLLHSRLPQDFRALATTIANEVEKIDGNNPDEFRESVLDAYAKVIRHMLGHTMMRYRFPGLFRIKQKLLGISKARIAPFWYERILKKNNFWKELSKNCTDKVLLSAYKEEIGNIETALQSDEFLSFIKTNAPDLIKE